MFELSLTIAGVLLFLFRHRVPWIGAVSHVADGDSLETLRFGKIVRIRLAGIDAPEWNQPHGREAHQALRNLIEHRVVLFLPSARDRYGRVVCNLLLGWTPVSCWMASSGHAWGLRLLPTLLTYAPRFRRKGLWASNNPIEPRIWRLAEQRFRLAPKRRLWASGR